MYLFSFDSKRLVSDLVGSSAHIKRIGKILPETSQLHTLALAVAWLLCQEAESVFIPGGPLPADTGQSERPQPFTRSQTNTGV